MHLKLIVGNSKLTVYEGLPTTIQKWVKNRKIQQIDVTEFVNTDSSYDVLHLTDLFGMDDGLQKLCIILTFVSSLW